MAFNKQSRPLLTSLGIMPKLDQSAFAGSDTVSTVQYIPKVKPQLGKAEVSLPRGQRLEHIRDQIKIA